MAPGNEPILITGVGINKKNISLKSVKIKVGTTIAALAEVDGDDAKIFDTNLTGDASEKN